MFKVTYLEDTGNTVVILTPRLEVVKYTPWIRVAPPLEPYREIAITAIISIEIDKVT